MQDHNTILTETIARHFEGAQIDGNEVDLGVADLHIACMVDSVGEVGGGRSASLFFQLWGGALGEMPIFASTSGYGDSAEEAIVVGGCNWACAFGPVLEAALAGKEAAEAETLELTIHGRKYLAVVDGLDRAMFYGEGGDVSEQARSARAHLGAKPWLLSMVAESGTLPVLPAHQATVLSVFCWESADQRILEVKVNGSDWLGSQRILDDCPPSPDRDAALLREFAILVPQDEPVALDRELLETTLAAATEGDEPRWLCGWRGWEAHGGELGQPASEIEVKRLENEIGRLPADYRDFLLSVQAQGAGPGYGLIAPFSAPQRVLAQGEFSWADGEEPETEPAGALLLAHAGCGVVWLLVVRGPRAGEVWVDAAGSDAVARRVAHTFDVWYRAWVDALVRNDETFAQWDARCCATPPVLSQLLNSIEADGLEGDDVVAELPNRLGPGAIGLATQGELYFESGDALDPCQPCCNLVAGFGIGLDVFKHGTAPKHARRSQ